MFSKSLFTPRKGAEALSPEQRQARSARRRRLWRKVGRGSLWLLAVAFVAHFSLNIYASVQLNRELAKIRAKGEPVRLSDMKPPSVPDAQNAAPLYKKATQALQLSTDAKEALAVRSGKLTPQLEKALEESPRTNRQTLELTRQAAAKPRCLFPLDWQGDPSKLLFPQYKEMRDLARILAADANVQAQKGNREAALTDVRALFGMSRHMSNEPTLIGFLVALAVDSVATKALSQVLERIPLSISEGHALEASLPKSDWKQAYRKALLGERTFGISGFESLGQRDAPISAENLDSFPIWLRPPFLRFAGPIVNLDEVQILRLWRGILDSPEAQQIPSPPTLGQMENQAIENAPFYAVLTRMFFPVFIRADMNRDRALVKQRQSVVAIALNCYRRERGRYPTILEEAQASWGRPLPLDLYSGKSFVYKSDGKSFTLYSIGSNRTDDGGKDPYSPGGSRFVPADDIVWSSS